MPKLVDHTARRAEIAAAVRRVILAEGTSEATVRRVAAEAGWSAGALRHYFPDQAALLRFAISFTFEAVPLRVAQHLGEAAPQDAQALLEELLPLDDDRRVEMHVWLAAMDQARHDAELDGVRAVAFAGMRQLCRVATSWLRDRPLPDDLGTLMEQPLPRDDDEDAAAQLHALIDGLALQSFCYPDHVGPDRMRHTLREGLAEVARSG